MPPLHFDLHTASGRADAIRSLQNGEIVALPTDTVPGLAIRADLIHAAAKLADLKGSSAQRPFTLHLADLQNLQQWAPSLPPGLPGWLSTYLPQACTALLPKAWLHLPTPLDWDWDQVGLRLPQHPDFRRVAMAIESPLLMTSVNPAGQLPLRGEALHQWLAARKIPAAHDLESGGSGQASPVVRFAPKPQRLRGPNNFPPLCLGLRVLVLCTGNICRSPLAEALLREAIACAWHQSADHMEELGWVFASAGTFAMAGGSISEHSLAVGRDMGLDLAAHRSQNLEQALQKPWDLILGMGPNHLEGLPDALPTALFDLAGQTVPDPFGGTKKDYRLMRDRLVKAVEQRIAAWSAWTEIV